MPPSFARATPNNRIASCGEVEWKYAKDLHNFINASQLDIEAKGEAAGVVDAKSLSAQLREQRVTRIPRQLVEIKDAFPGGFCDLVVEVSIHRRCESDEADSQPSRRSAAGTPGLRCAKLSSLRTSGLRST